MAYQHGEYTKARLLLIDFNTDWCLGSRCYALVVNVIKFVM